ncbi:MAG: hypothetical protein ACYSW3_27735 [Planctomycetota bacterium]
MKQYPEPGRLVMKLFYYYFNCRANQEWRCSRAQTH